MISILFISDDARAAELLALLKPHCRARMRLSADFDQGLKEVFDNRPAAVFIQNSISGISGETVARHIKTLLRGDAPRIVLAHRDSLKLQGGKKWFDDTFDFSLADQELLASFRNQLVAIAPDQWQETDVPDETPPSADAAPIGTGDAAGPAPDFEFFDWETAPAPPEPEPPCPPAVPADAVSVPESPAEVFSRSEQEPAAVELPAPPTAVAAATCPPPEPPVPPVVVPPPAPPIVTAAAEQRPVAEPAPAPAAPSGVGDNVPPAAVPEPSFEWAAIPSPEYETGSTRQGVRLSLWLPLTALALAAVVGGALFFLRPTSSPVIPPAKRSPAQTPAPAVPATGPAKPVALPPAAPKQSALPSFVPAAGLDPGFAKANPGWERYLGKTMEFRLFREKGALRAVQVIGRHGAAIPASFVATVSKELLGDTVRGRLARQRKAGYLVEQGRFGGKGEIALYRQKGGAIRGIVVSLP